ncbi:hypothetical protein HanXRQr2_Chr11g0512391 [Helianthus annuus]|uniref:Uncharacterized protein n=1 Tax=Helianthus annuus TaxID=4232 RepID=A0A9K3N1T1_HELAN|nr:hypothetical protein HanXRQr2_Chr11g0512391 [Helianthus annuus]KAJ0876896.1 hypothetical protein HanPSC8_Chr11g0493711 [Helianthus annuus]
MSGPPSREAMLRPGSTTGNNKPQSFQRPINQKPPSEGQVDNRFKDSNTQPVKGSETTPANQASFQDATHADNK